MNARALHIFFVLNTITALQMASPPAHADQETPTQTVAVTGGEAESCPCRDTVAVPLVRWAILDSLKYVGLIAIWPEAYAPSEGSRDTFVSGFQNYPRWEPDRSFFGSDGDPAYFNILFHGLAGSESYLSARVWGQTPLVAFALSMAESVVWEFMVEGWFENPSMIDLIWTPFGGILIGELRYQVFRLARDRIHRIFPRVLIMTLMDPVGQVERAILGCRYLSDPSSNVSQ